MNNVSGLCGWVRGLFNGFGFGVWVMWSLVFMVGSYGM